VDFSYELSTFLLNSYLPLALAFVIGALFGSFFHLCSERIAIGVSIVSPRSYCQACHTPIAWYDNIPLVSYLILRAKCRTCRTKIAISHFMVELFCGFLATLLFYRFRHSSSTLSWIVLHASVYFLFTGVLLVLSLIDWKFFILPDKITYPGVVLFFIAGQLLKDHSLVDCLIGMGVGYSLLRLISDGYYFLFKKEGLGRGDAKLLMLIGGLLGWQSLPLVLFGASVIAILYGVILHQRNTQKDTSFSSTKVPLGPFLSLGAVMVVLVFAEKNPLEQLALWLLPS